MLSQSILKKKPKTNLGTLWSFAWLYFRRQYSELQFWVNEQMTMFDLEFKSAFRHKNNERPVEKIRVYRSRSETAFSQGRSHVTPKPDLRPRENQKSTSEEKASSSPSMKK